MDLIQNLLNFLDEISGRLWESHLFKFEFLQSLALLYLTLISPVTGFPDGSDGKESACSVRDQSYTPGSGRFPWRRKWQPTPVSLLWKSHGQRNLVHYSPWGHKESDVTEWLTSSQFHFHLQLLTQWLAGGSNS